MGLTLTQYAKAKGLPIEHLRRLGVHDVGASEAEKIMRRWVPAEPAVAFPYFDASGAVQFKRVRWSMTSTPMQPKGQKVTTPYGLNWLPEKRSDLLLVEGESDLQTLLLYDLPALGIPGANNFKPEWAPILAPYKRVFVWHERDDAADGLVRAVSAVHPNVHVLTVEGVKDASDLHMTRPGTFRAEVVAAAKNARRAVPSPEPRQARPHRRRAPSRDRRHLNIIEAMASVVVDVDRLEDLRLGQQAFLTCPFHNDAHPSLHVDPESNRWYCFPCGIGGGVKDFIERAGLDWREVKRDRLRDANGVLA